MNLDIESVVAARAFPARLERDLVKVLVANVYKPSRTRRRKNVIGNETQISRIYAVVGFIETLRELNFHVQTLENLRQDHVEALHQHWVERGLSHGRITGLNCHLRTLCKWLKKRDLVAPVAKLVEDFHRPSVTRTDKAWSGKGVTIEAVLATVRACDEFGQVVAVQLELEWVLGLRVQESWLLRPLPALIEAINGACVLIEDGTKGHRPRDLQLDLLMQIDVLYRAVSFEKSSGSSTIPARFTLDQWSNHFSYVLRKAKLYKDVSKGGLGVTAHGLRHEFLQGLYHRITGHKPPVGGGFDVPLAEYRSALRIITKAAGHSDPSKAGAYLSTVSAMRRHLAKASELCKDKKAVLATGD